MRHASHTHRRRRALSPAEKQARRLLCRIEQLCLLAGPCGDHLHQDTWRTSQYRTSLLGMLRTVEDTVATLRPSDQALVHRVCRQREPEMQVARSLRMPRSTLHTRLCRIYRTVARELRCEGWC